jgi:signal transduction histidine kinase
MTLRLRITLLFTSLLGGILLLFGLAVYWAVTYSLIDQFDINLIQAAENIITAADVNPEGQLVLPPLSTLGLTTEVYAQVWDRSGRQVGVSENLGAGKAAIDPDGRQMAIPIFRDIYPASGHLRVLTVPLVAGTRAVGVLQVGAVATLIDNTQETLLKVLVIGILIAILVAAVATGYSTNRALAPLKDVTQAALQITKAGDLSRRIPYQGPAEDEIGQLVQAFNQTLSKLENQFHTQKRFMADVGHELRTPLTVIKGNVGLMRRMGADEESLSGIESEVDRLTRLVGDLLLLAQAESGKLPLDRRLVELDTLLLEALQQMRVLARDKLELQLGEIDQVLVCGDKDRLKQVLVNLIGNAIGYTPLGGEVVVSLGKVGHQARLVVSDNGPGIPPEDLTHIFERFYRGQKSRTRSRDGKGFGLGLSIAYWIVRHHDGRIEVDSTEGRGTSFCVWLPLAQGDCQS